MARKEKKIRLDEALLRLGLAGSLDKARALIMRGDVFVKGQRLDKAGQAVAPDAEITLKERCPYVSRGGLKLAGALEAAGFDPQGLTALDAGSSTGGFTDCLLQRGAALVYAVDVGVGIMDWKLRTDPRVRLLEGVNIRGLALSDIGGEPADMAVMDLSFISLRKVLPVVRALVREGARVFALVKPQFEARRDEVGRGGVVRDESVQRRVVEEMLAFAEGEGFRALGISESPVRGAKGNREFWIFLEAVKVP